MNAAWCDKSVGRFPYWQCHKTGMYGARFRHALRSIGLLDNVSRCVKVNTELQRRVLMDWMEAFIYLLAVMTCVYSSSTTTKETRSMQPVSSWSKHYPILLKMFSAPPPEYCDVMSMFVSVRMPACVSASQIYMSKLRHILHRCTVVALAKYLCCKCFNSVTKCVQLCFWILKF